MVRLSSTAFSRLLSSCFSGRITPRQQKEDNRSASSRSAHSGSIIALLLAFALCLPLLAGPAFAGHGAPSKARKAILLVAFGTTVPEAKIALDNINNRVHAAYPETEIRWAYTSHIIRTKLRAEGQQIDSPAEALAKLGENGFTDIAVQSLHTIPGEEYHALIRTAMAFQNMPKGTRTVALGAPLLSTHDDMTAVAAALCKNIPAERAENEAVIFMGHGTHHAANIYYPGLQYYLSRLDANVFVGTVEGAPLLEDIIPVLKQRGIKKVWLMPFMSVAGDHARNDMAGPEEDSWKSILEKEGFSTRPVLKGTAEYDNIVDVWLEHLNTVVTRLP